MRNFTIMVNDGPGKGAGEWLLHKAGCQDLGKWDAIDTWEATDAKAAVTDWIDDEMIEMGWAEDDVRVMPCAK